MPSLSEAEWLAVQTEWEIGVLTDRALSKRSGTASCLGVGTDRR
jgi:hypothetical protein